MINHIKRLWGHYLALLILGAILFFPISRIHRFFQAFFGNEAALISLTITIMVVMAFGIRGAVYAHRIIKDMQQAIPCADNPTSQQQTCISILFRVFKIKCSEPGNTTQKTNKETDNADVSLPYFMLSNKKRRGKQPRFPEEKIRKAVLRWENRDPSFSVATLEEFLAQEFGSSPDGILLMAPTTFYDWRRRILEEIKSRSHE
ncbi:MAG: hypothetical protein HY865_24690 [Chloroflexi bacterium]|nr:hypothetical protein [Chloroflexota bacterium]